ncbi:hypothetical protein EV356DRAFT_508850 [Viridothelium virens]|uniref:Uncharacterized protein n=1 Tax=Viridothelium virens TaxID=1048519 RepID=A0A6A6HJ64_VIRVR|nr:hypothetical protein EV356DRAFT_508850 [Viridothelium virens]
MRRLFTAPNESDPYWQQAHQTLMPAFDPLASRDIQRDGPKAIVANLDSAINRIAEGSGLSLSPLLEMDSLRITLHSLLHGLRHWEVNRSFPMSNMPSLGAWDATFQRIPTLIEASRATALLQNVRPERFIQAECLTDPEESEQRHLEIQLRVDMSYNAGDYLAVSAMNLDQTVCRVLTRCSLLWRAVITIKDGEPETILSNKAVSVFDLLESYVELSPPVAKCGSRCPTNIHLQH